MTAQPIEVAPEPTAEDGAQDRGATPDPAGLAYARSLWRPGDVRELRILGAGRHGRGTLIGYFEDPGRLAAAAAGWDGRADVFLTVNPVVDALLGRAENKLGSASAERGSGTADAYVARLRWLPIDIDPVRVPGVSSSDAELTASLEVARAVAAYGLDHGLGLPITSMSGNGHHLLYPIDLPNDAAGRGLVARVVGHLDERFSGPAVKLDVSVVNPARIMTLIGTMKRKGESTKARPHRRSLILHAPAALVPIAIERLHELAPATDGPGAIVVSGDRMPPGWVRSWLDDAGVEYEAQPTDASGTTWHHLVRCPFHPEDDVPSRCGVAERADGQAAGQCHHKRGADKGWKDFREALGLGPKPSASGPAGRGGGSDAAPPYPEPEDRSEAKLSEASDSDCVEDFLRAGRIHVVGAEEGAGKTYAAKEVGIRVAVAGGHVAGTWPVLLTGPVLDMSEMHPDDDYEYEQTVLDSLGVPRSLLEGRYYRLSLMTAAHGKPALMDPAWRVWATAWLRRVGARLLIVDTATGATRIDPWGEAIKLLYHELRVMLAELPEVAVVLIVHLRKPNGKGERRISDVQGEWARWCDILILLERDGERTKVSTHKRVRHQRRILATRAGGLLVDPLDITDAKPAQKVPPERIMAAIEAEPGITYARLAQQLGVGKRTADRYVAALGDRVTVVSGSRSEPAKVYPRAAGAPPPDVGVRQVRHGASGAGDAPPDAGDDVGVRQVRHPPYRGGAPDDAPTSASPDDAPVEDEYPPGAWDVDGEGEPPRPEGATWINGGAAADSPPEAADGLCPTCQVGPFLTAESYDRHQCTAPT